METFAASSAKLFVDNHRLQLHSISFLSCHSPTPREAAAALLLCRPTDTLFLGENLSKHHRPFSSLSPTLLHRKAIVPVSLATAFSAPETQSLTGDEVIHTKDTTKFDTVHVKFQLQRECSFGQQFLMVGDDPMFGLWDPLNAIPLNWSEGDIWVVEMDIPCDKLMKYKFILKGANDTILWQPGPDRILQTWETRKTITVCEDWNNAELQIVLEEEPITYQLSESIEVSQVLKEPENLFQPNGNSESFIKKELPSKNTYSKPNEIILAEKPIAAVAENITGKNGGEKEVEAIGFPVAELTPSADKVATLEIMDYPNTGRSSSIEINLDSGAAVPVLVPGLTPMPLAESKEAEASSAAVPVLVPGLTPMPLADSEEAEASISRAEKHTDSSLNVPEPAYVKEEPGIDLLIRTEGTQIRLNDQHAPNEKGCEEAQEPKLFEEKELPDNKVKVEDGVVKNDLQWGRRTLQQFLVSLGLF